jgi:N-acyl-D-aspartate/D-glutamate deacylase
VIRAIFLLASVALAQEAPFDILITGGRIVDGSGNAWYRADLGVRGGRIAAIGALRGRPTKRTIDARNHIIAPGFVDMMGASSEPLLENRDSAESKLRQGITTMLGGEGNSTAPSAKWPTFDAYFRALEAKGIPINTIHNVGAAQVRRQVIGDENRAPTEPEMAKMRALVEQAMKDGVAGFSTALIYPPGTYATTAELVEMAKVVGRYGGIYLTHMRNESHAVLDAITESIRIGRAGGVPVHIFHLKAAGQDNWPRMQRAIDTIQGARDLGLDVTADIYPYIRNGLGLVSLIHPRHFGKGAKPLLETLSDPAVRASLRQEIESTTDWENWYRHVGSDWNNILVASVGGSLDKAYEAKSIAEIAKLRNADEWTTFFDLAATNSVSVNPKSMNEEQKNLAFRTEWVSLCTDAPPTLITATGAHPRAFGAFPRVLSHYVREEHVLSIESAIRKMSSLPANRLGLHDRSRIAPGLPADLVIFNPETVRDTATFEKPLSFPEGIPHVIVNGVAVIDAGRFTNANPGRVLRYRR